MRHAPGVRTAARPNFAAAAIFHAPAVVPFSWWWLKAFMANSADVAGSETPPSLSPDLEPSTVTSRRIGPLLLFFVALGLVGYFVFDAANGFVNADVVDGRVATLRTDIDDLEWQADQLSALVAFLDSDEYIERTAREELGLVRPGEEAIAIEAPNQPGLRIARSPWWANLLPEPVQRPPDQ